MYKILPLLGLAISSVAGLSAGPVNTEVIGYSSVCTGAATCHSEGGQSSVLASFSNTSVYDAIHLSGEADFSVGRGTPHAYYDYTFNLPNNWDEVVEKVIIRGQGNIQGEALLGQSTGTGAYDSLFNVNGPEETIALSPTAIRQIRFEYDLEGISGEGYVTFDVNLSDPNAPTPTPEPASGALLAFPMLALGIARWRSRR